MLGFSAISEYSLGSTSSSTASSSDTTAPIFTGTLVQTAVTSTSCTIDWSGTTHTDNVGITGYEYSINGGTYYALGNVLSYTFAGFTASTTYTISLRAFDAAGNRSTVLSITTMTSAPSVSSTGLFNEYFFTIMRQSNMSNSGTITNAPINRIGTFV